MSRRPTRHGRVLMTVVAALLLPSCILYVSSSPTSVGGATIVFVAVDGRGGSVESLAIRVVDLRGEWTGQATTSVGGSCSLVVGASVKRVRVDVTPPAGYVLTDARGWPREVDVSPGRNVRIEIMVRRSVADGQPTRHHGVAAGRAGQWSLRPFMPAGSASPTRLHVIGPPRPRLVSMNAAAS